MTDKQQETVEQTIQESAAKGESVAQVSSVEETSQTDAQSTEKKDEMPGIIERLTARFKKAKEEAPEDANKQVDVTESVEDKTQDTEGDVIPDEFIAAAKAAGWTEDQIVEFASDYKDAELQEMVADLTPAKPQEATAQEKPEKVEQKGQEQTSQDQSEIAALRKELTALKEQIGKHTEKTEQQEVVEREQHANEVFDTLGKEWDEFGETKSLPRFPDGRYIPSSPQMKARVEVWQHAQQFHQRLEVPWQEAMKLAVDLYKGRHGETHTHNKVVKDLKSNTKRLTAKRSSKQTERVYENEDERQADVISSAARSVGVELPWMN